MNEILIKNKKFLTPSSWNELSKEQLLYVTKLFFENLSFSDFKIKVILFFLGKGNNVVETYRKIKKYKRKKLFKRSILNDIENDLNADLFLLAETTDFLLNVPDLTINKFPGIKIGLKKLYGPTDELRNISLIEFAKADTKYLSYRNTKDEKYLNELIAVLYRPKKWFIGFRKIMNIYDGDPRMKFSDMFIIQNIKKIGKLPFCTRYAIYLFYEGCRNKIVKNHPEVFNESGEENGYGWAGIITELAGTKFGNDKETAETLLYTVLLHLEISAERIKKLKNKD